MPKYDLAIKLGTSNTSIFLSGNGIVLHEPSVIAYADARRSRDFLAAGKTAKQMLGKAPEKTSVYTPMSQGVAVDPEGAADMLRHFLSKITRPGLMPKRMRAIVCVPCGLAPADRQAYEDVCMAAGVYEVLLLERVVAAAVGANLPVASAHGGVCVNIGGGTTEIGVLSLGGIISGCSVNIGGQAMDEAVRDQIEHKYMIQVGALTSEKIKEEVGSLYESDAAAAMVSGMNANTRTPESAVVSASDIRDAVAPLYNRIAAQISSIINVCPAEMGSDIYRAGIVLSGGGSKIAGIDKVFRARLNLPVRVDEDPEYSVINGAGRLLNDDELLAVILKNF